MNDLKKTIKMIMNYISKKPDLQHEDEGAECYILTIKKDLFFRNHIRNSLEKSFSNKKLSDLYNIYCKKNFTKNNIILYK